MTDENKEIETADTADNKKTKNAGKKNQPTFFPTPTTLNKDCRLFV